MWKMTAKVIYFSIGGREEQAEFRIDAPNEDVKECFRSAAEAGPYDILKLYNSKGNLVNISNRLEENTIDQRYKLEVVAAHCGHCGKDLHGVDVEDIETRLQSLEKKVFVDHGSMPVDFRELKERVDVFKEKLESVEHLSWLGLFKDMASGPTPPPPDRKMGPKNIVECNNVFERYLKMGSAQPSDETLSNLRYPSFDNWQWEDAEMLFLVQQMYVDLGLTEAFHIETSTLQQFLFEVYQSYNHIPFHNFRHCFCVTQMMYGMIWLSKVYDLIEKHDVLTMLTAAICHDLDHPGYNNAYQVNARTELAIRYNDISPLENHHASVAFDILSRPNCNIFSHLRPEIFRKVREGMIKCILATDMARHNEVLHHFKKILADGFDYDNPEHRQSLMNCFIKAADISNEARPMEVAEPWLECLLQEFFNQSDVEKMEGLPVAPFMDRDKVTKPSSQIGFIKFVLLPLMDALGQLFPTFEEKLIQPIRNALDYYQQMAKNLDEDRKKNADRRPSVEQIERKLSNGLSNGPSGVVGKGTSSTG